MIMEPHTEVEVAPRVYCIDDNHLFLNWIAEGTDGCFYTVPSEPGGWKRRSPFDGELRELKLVSPTKAHAIVQFVGGACKDWGPVTIAEGTHHDQEFWAATLENAQTAG